MKWGVIGYGSIGKRHVKNILSLRDEVIVLTKNKECVHTTCKSIEELLTIHLPEVILLCNETSSHINSYKEIRSHNKELRLLIEKPIFDKIYNLPSDPNVCVAYCMRFHPLINKLKEKISASKVLAAKFYVGQYLPNWREGRNYQDTYSAKKERGGGVLRDLSHEIDLAQFLLGDLSLNYSFSSKISDLEISSDDIFTGFFKTKTCPNIIVEMNYLDQIFQRYLVIFTNEKTIKIDFINGTISTNQISEKIEFDKNEMYLEMLMKFKINGCNDLATFRDGLNILALIELAEK